MRLGAANGIPAGGVFVEFAHFRAAPGRLGLCALAVATGG